MLIPVDFEAYLRYSRGKSSPEEARAVRQWLAQPANGLLAQHWMSKFVEMLEQEEVSASELPSTERLESRLFHQLGFEPEQPRSLELPEPESTARPLWRRWAAAAAVLVLAAGGGWLWQHQQGQASGAAEKYYATAYGETSTVYLPDGSEVKLNSHSTLRYADNLLDGKAREVWLDGEGYFSIKHLPDSRRFIVHTTAGLNVEVLGTKFTVFRRHAQARVVLLSGKVRVAFADSSKRKPVILKPGELLETRDAQPQKVVHKPVHVDTYAAWKDDKLVFDETPVAEVATRLSDTYGVKVIVATPALNQRTVTGTFPAGELNTVLQVLEKSFKLTVERQQNQIVLSE
ncbi:FecR family protein [Hymenobacter crusticola]|nr:FecR domain-containing protein [Hymenobacter crusticola]